MQDSEDMDDNASQGEGGNNDSGEQEAIVVAGGGEAAAASGDAAGAGSSTALAMISAARPPGSMSVTSDEVNYLIFRYVGWSPYRGHVEVINTKTTAYDLGGAS